MRGHLDTPSILVACYTFCANQPPLQAADKIVQHGITWRYRDINGAAIPGFGLGGTGFASGHLRFACHEYTGKASATR